MQRLLVTTAIVLTLTLAGCGAPKAHTDVDATESSTVEDPFAPIDEKIEDWQPLSDFEIKPFNEGNDKFADQQIELVSRDIIKLAEKQLSFNVSRSKEQVEEQVQEFTSSAPHKLSKYMADQAKADSKDKGKNFWTMSYIQPINNSFAIEDDSRFTYAWQQTLEPFQGQMGVTVTLFTRSAYWLKADTGERSMVTVGRWISLGSVNPANSTATGDYAWHTRSFISNASVCPAFEGEPIEPEMGEDTDLDSLEEFVSVDRSTFAPADDFKLDQEAIDRERKKCQK